MYVCVFTVFPVVAVNRFYSSAGRVPGIKKSPHLSIDLQTVGVLDYWATTFSHTCSIVIDCMLILSCILYTSV